MFGRRTEAETLQVEEDQVEEDSAKEKIRIPSHFTPIIRLAVIGGNEVKITPLADGRYLAVEVWTEGETYTLTWMKPDIETVGRSWNYTGASDTQGNFYSSAQIKKILLEKTRY